MSGVKRTADGTYHLLMTRAQIERVRDFNERSTMSPKHAIGRNADCVTIVDDDDKEVDMVTGQWFGMVIGILPDGSAHS